MIALLLNSGRGTRMGDETKTHPKCMTMLDDQDTIISHQVHLLRENGITEAVVTTGPFAQLLQDYLESLNSGIHFTYISNPRYEETNYIYSMYVAREALHGQDVISLHGDLVMTNEVMSQLVHAPVSTVVVDTTLPLPEKDFKARLTDGRVQAIGIDQFGADCAASQPAYKWLAKDFHRWMEEIEKFVSAGEVKCYAENAFNAAWQEIPLYPLDVKGQLCSEIDNMEDKACVCARFAREVRHNA